MNAMLLLKATLLWSMALAGASLLRRAHAADRHRFWTIGFAAVLLLPALTLTLPSLDIPIPAWQAAIGAEGARPASAAPAIPYEIPFTTTRSQRQGRPIDVYRTAPSVATALFSRRIPWASLRTMLVTAWAAGAAAAVGMLMLSLIRAYRLRRSGAALDDESWRETVASLANQLGLSPAVGLIVHRDVTTPMAGGFWRPVIFLPVSAPAWSDEQRGIVLAHELAHLRGRDPLRLVAVRLAVALYWFHPLAWLAARQESIAREQACDAAVLAIGTRPSAYARVLLDFADSMAPRTHVLAALPIVEPTLLEKRLVEILKDDRRQTARSRVLLPLTLAAAATVTIAAARPVAMVMLPIPASVPFASSYLAVPPALASVPPAAPVAVLASGPAQRRGGDDFACWTGGVYGSSFSGTITSTGSDVTRQIGTSGADRVIQESLGNLRVCMVAQNVGDRSVDELPSAWIGHADRVLMETRRGDAIQRLTLEGAGVQRVTWTVNGADRSFDAAAQQWRDRMLALVDLMWQISSIRGHVSALRGEISTMRGQESTLRGEISTLRGDVSTMRGRQSTLRGDESSLRGEISTIRGHVSSLRGQISSEEGAISGLNGTRDDANPSERSRIDASVARHKDAIKRIEHGLQDYDEDAKVAEVEKRIQALDADAKVSAIDVEIRRFDVDRKVATIEQQIKDLDVDRKTAAVEKKIDDLDADRKVRDLENRRDKARDDLEAAVSRIR